MMKQTEFRFDGSTFDGGVDGPRLSSQILRVFEAMKDSHWRTLAQIEAFTGDPQASVSARLRDLRKKRFGSHEVNRRRKVETKGTWIYQLIPSQPYVGPSEPEEEVLE